MVCVIWGSFLLVRQRLRLFIESFENFELLSAPKTSCEERKNGTTTQRDKTPRADSLHRLSQLPATVEKLWGVLLRRNTEARKLLSYFGHDASEPKSSTRDPKQNQVFDSSAAS